MKPRSKRQTKSKRNVKSFAKSTGKKVSGKERKKDSKNARPGSSNRTEKTHSRNAKRKELVSKDKTKSKIQVPAKSSRKGGNKSKTSNAQTRVGTLAISHSRTKQNIDVSFKGAKSISKKLKTFEKSSTIDKAVARQLKRKGGKPPRGVIISISDKTGIVETIVSKPSMVVNEKNVKVLVLRLLKGEKKFKRSQYGSFDERFDPDHIDNINIRFVYSTLNKKL